MDPDVFAFLFFKNINPLMLIALWISGWYRRHYWDRYVITGWLSCAV